MMSTLANGRVLLDAGASDFAFHAGQLVERILLERGVEVARQAGTSVATVDHIQSGVDGALLDQLRERLGNRFHGNQGHEQRKTA